MALRSYLHSTFDPRRIPGLQAWYDAADSASITLDAGRVSQWSDKSGNARHATNTTSGSTQPSYSTAARNGLNVLTFAAASVQRLTVAGAGTFNFLHNGTESFVIAVVKYGTVADPQTIYALFGNNGIGNARIGVTVAYDDRNNGFGNTDSLFAHITNAGAAAANTFNATDTAIIAGYANVFSPQAYLVQEIVFSASASTVSQRLRLRVNGATEVAGNVKTGTASTADATFSLQIGSTGNNSVPLQGDICELLFFNQQPTAAARDLIRRYLGAKWGVTVG